MAEQTPDTPSKRRDLLSVLGMVAVAGAAAFTSYSGLSGLAELAGWPSKLALMLPITIDAYAMTATRVWLSPARLTKKARAWARGNAIGAISMSVLGNTIYHAASAHVLSVTWPVVVGISAIPSIVLGLTVHLWHVADDLDPEPAPSQSPGPAIAEPEQVRAAYPILGSTRPNGTVTASGRRASADASRPTPRGASAAGGSSTGERSPKPLPALAKEADKSSKRTRQLDQARAADTAHLEATSKPISARKLAEQLHVHQSTAGELLREVRTTPPLPAHPRTAPRRGPGRIGGPAEARCHTDNSDPGAPRCGSTAEPASATASDAVPGTVPGPRPAPVEHANGAGPPPPDTARSVDGMETDAEQPPAPLRPTPGPIPRPRRRPAAQRRADRAERDEARWDASYAKAVTPAQLAAVDFDRVRSAQEPRAHRPGARGPALGRAVRSAAAAA